MKITLNIHGTLAKFYRAFWNDPDLPNNLCSYFWKLILAFVLFPICYPMLIINGLSNPYYYEKGSSWYSEGYKESGERASSAYGLLFNGLFIVIGLLVSGWVFGDMVNYMSIWKLYFNGIIVAISIVALVLIIIYSVVLIQKLIPKKEPKQETEEEIALNDKKRYEAYLKKEARKQKSIWYLTKKMFIAWKEKNCPIIEWKK